MRLRRRWAWTIPVLAAACLLLGACRASQQAGILTPDAYQRHVNYLASDELGGRGLGTPGIEKAAEYIARQFRAYGLQPAGEGGSFFQTLEVRLQAERTSAGSLRFTGVAPEAAVRDGTDFVAFPFSAEEEFSGAVAFAGYAIVNDDKGYNDVTDLDATGKVLLVLRREPPSWAESGEPTPHASFRSKVYNARDNGATAILIVNQALTPDESDTLVSWQQLGGEEAGGEYGLPALHITRALAERLLAAGGLPPLADLQSKLDAGQRCSAPLAGVAVTGQAGIRRQKTTTRNVLARLPGTGPEADEVIVIGAHYDHLGLVVSRTVLAKGGTAAARPEIHNGADDNASGTAGVLELARAFAADGAPRRSILFAAFTAEESGLLGSKHFADHPTVPIENIVAMINLDMIGRLPSDSRVLQVFGSQAAVEMEDLLKRIAAEQNLELRTTGSGFGPSDQSSFYGRQIPSVHVFTGLHRDYHLPSDDANLINADGAVLALGYVRALVREIADRDTRLTYQKVTLPPDMSRGSYRVRMGLMPGFGDDPLGFRVDAVTEGGPAAQAGMRDGDVITRLGDSPVKNIYDYMGALRKYNPGDQAEVTVLRNGEEMHFTVTLTGG